MNEPLNDEEFAAYLGRRSALSRRYQDLQEAEPPASLSSAVLAQAAAETRWGRWRRHSRWTVPVALAASVVLAVTALLESSAVHQSQAPTAVPQESKETVVTVDVAPAAAPVFADRFDAAEAPVNVAEEVTPAVQATKRVDAEKSRAKREGRSSGAVSNAAIASPLMEREVQATELSQLSAANVKSEPPNAPAPAAQAASGAALDRAADARMRESAQLSDKATQPIGVEAPGKWLDKIEALRKQGKTAQADEQMRQFLKRYPDYLTTIPSTAPARDNQAGSPPE